MRLVAHSTFQRRETQNNETLTIVFSVEKKSALDGYDDDELVCMVISVTNLPTIEDVFLLNLTIYSIISFLYICMMEVLDSRMQRIIRKRRQKLVETKEYNSSWSRLRDEI